MGADVAGQQVKGAAVLERRLRRAKARWTPWSNLLTGR
jgi:hypothetical protein